MNTAAHVWLAVFDRLAQQKGHTVKYSFTDVRNKKSSETMKKKVCGAINIDTYVDTPDTVEETLSNMKKTIVDKLGIHGCSSEMKDKYVELYQKHHAAVNMLLKYHTVEKNNTVVDEYDDKLFQALVVPFEEIVGKFKLDDAKNEFTPKMFTTMLNNISFDNKLIDVIRIKSKGAKFKENIDIVRVCWQNSVMFTRELNISRNKIRRQKELSPDM